MFFVLSWLPLIPAEVAMYAPFPCIFIDSVLLFCLSITAEGVLYKVFHFFRMALTRVIVMNSVHKRMSRRTETPKAAEMPITATLLRESLLAEVDEAVVTAGVGEEEGIYKVVESDGEEEEPEEGVDKLVESDGEGEELVGADKVVVREPAGYHTTLSLVDMFK